MDAKDCAMLWGFGKLYGLFQDCWLHLTADDPLPPFLKVNLKKKIIQKVESCTTWDVGNPYK